jgi:hypothetical protein
VRRASQRRLRPFALLGQEITRQRHARLTGADEHGRAGSPFSSGICGARSLRQPGSGRFFFVPVFWTSAVESVRYDPGSRRSGRVAEGGALLRRYGGECLHRGFESLLLRFKMVDAMRSSVSGRDLVALGRAGRTPPMLVAWVVAWRREADGAAGRPRKRPGSRAVSGPDTPERAPSTRDHGISHLGSRYQPLQGRTDDVTVMAGQLVDVVREVRGAPDDDILVPDRLAVDPRANVRRIGRADGKRTPRRSLLGGSGGATRRLAGTAGPSARA